ncbi:AAA family ATPase [Streptomyces sp. NPDC002574]|uniref:AAA family ATPase n=1 Tax=Streptomyces sp. NPDC002574 TaxID=3364652 RepID=UPI0036976290
MSEFDHGLVLGKFYPPHAGHHHLVRTAAARCRRLTVLVCASAVESIPLADRMAWMREEHPETGIEVVGAVDDIPVDITDPTVWDAHMAIFRAAVPDLVDAVFTSEPYGDELGRRFGATAVTVDVARTMYPVSGTAVRSDPVGCWPYLAAPVRAGLTRRVVVVGAESTGTTTMAQALAEHYRARGGVWVATRWVPEYGRTYSEEKYAKLLALNPKAIFNDVTWTSPDFELIAKHQLADENAAARAGSPILFCDTDPLATTIWHERYMGARNPEVEAIAARGRHHLWLLTDDAGVPFEDDGLRDGEHLRTWMTNRFREELTRRNLPHIVLTGPHAQRLRTAVSAVDALLAGGWQFAAPLPEHGGLASPE